ncbi:leucine-rich repeats and immunoglobulin-like domains protein 1 [Branchiostoma floridae]|uniref:Leucine-rich repeats and immunoglobulin-like domains protein 1 n=1 Tax=Branchiostoma floridae TaxID=7739 RepID=A0A9J7N4D0_BRAFL|nr:leucine-rich repeats and immunoglobulin-like domains protein 1 [Branchiostoma floridae]
MDGKRPRHLAGKVYGFGGNCYVHVALILLVVAELCEGWRGGVYWTSRYSGQGVSYENWIGFWSHDSHYTGYGHHYQTYWPSYYRYPHCGACYCNTTASTVSCSSASSIGLKRITYRFNLTKSTFSPTVTSIAIYNSGLYYNEKGTFDLLSSLGSLTLHATNLLNFPDVSRCSSLTRLDLSRNKITFPVGVDPGRLLPDSLTHLALMENDISWIPKGFFSYTNLQFLGLSRNKIKQIPSNAIEHMNDLQFLSLDGNQLTSLSWRTLNTLETSNVTHLNFSNNQISHVGSKAFYLLRSLKIL